MVIALAGRGGAVMTTRTVARSIHATVIETGVGPVNGGQMTVVALRRGLNMLRRFTRRPITVMTGGTGTTGFNIVMIEGHRGPVLGGIVTAIALRRGRDMSIGFTG
jgi:hypothetical protein